MQGYCWTTAGVSNQVSNGSSLWNNSATKFDATRLEYKTDDITGRIDDTSLVRGLLTEQFGNKYTMLNIPLYLGYEKRFGRWVFGIEGGVGFNIHFRTSGKVLVDDQKFSHWTTGMIFMPHLQASAGE